MTKRKEHKNKKQTFVQSELKGEENQSRSPGIDFIETQAVSTSQVNIFTCCVQNKLKREK